MWYLGPVWHQGILKFHKNKLEVIDNLVLRRVLGAPMSTKKCILQRDTEIQYFSRRAETPVKCFENTYECWSKKPRYEASQKAATDDWGRVGRAKLQSDLSNGDRYWEALEEQKIAQKEHHDQESSESSRDI